jgi:Domain of unknown function (DUF3597)
LSVFESIRQEMVKHAASNAPQLEIAARHNLTAEEVVGVLSSMDANRSEKLHWQTSIVGLMNVLGLDSSSSTLKLLSQELGYRGDMDSTALTGWLHRAVMQKLTDPGG